MSRFKPYFFITLLGLLVYHKVLFFDFVYLDDKILISDSQEFLADIGNIFESFRQGVFIPAGQKVGAFYRPMLNISYIFDTQLGNSLVIYHASNLVIHLIASFLLFNLLLILGMRKMLALLFSLIFTIHPILTAAIAWIPGRNDSLVAIFLFASFINFIRYFKNSRYLNLFWHLVFFILSLFTKETALLIPIISLIYLAIFKSKKILSIKTFILIFFWASAIITFLFLRKTYLKGEVVEGFGMMTYFAFIQLPGILLYIGKILIPVNLSVYPHLADQTLIFGGVSVFFLFTVFLVSYYKKIKINYRMLLFGVLWFFIFLLPTMVILEKHSSGVLREHRAYIPLVGFILIMSEIPFIKNINFKKAANLLVFFILLMLFASITFVYSGSYRDGLSFWSQAVMTSPTSSISYINLGVMYEKKGMLNEAEMQYFKVLEINERLPGIHNNLGTIYLRKNEYDKARGEFEKELEINPDFEMAKRNLDLIKQR